MNRTIAVVLFATATWMAGPRAPAQAKELTVDIPFSFTVNNTVLPAGSYTLGFDSTSRNRLIIQGRTRSIRALAFVQRGFIGEGKEDGLIFHRYGGEYFLSEVGFDSALDGVSLPVTKLERKARAGRNEELAFLAGH